MNTEEILTAVAFAKVPDGSQLATHDVGGGMTISHHDEASIKSGSMEIMIAGILEDELLASTSGHTAVTPDFFRALHQALIDWRNAMLDRGSVIESWDEDVRADFQVYLAKARALAAEHGVAYQEPTDNRPG